MDTLIFRTFEKYKEHPRVLELRFILLFDMFERDYGYHGALKIYEAIAGAFHCDMTKIMGLINRRFDLKRLSKTRKLRWKQEVIFTANCYGESLYKVAKDYLIVASSNLYASPEKHDVKVFATDEWLRQLDDEVLLCGMKPYRIEVLRFFEAVESLTNVLLRWKGMS